MKYEDEGGRVSEQRIAVFKTAAGDKLYHVMCCGFFDQEISNTDPWSMNTLHWRRYSKRMCAQKEVGRQVAGCATLIFSKKKEEKKRLYYIFDLTYPPKDCLCGSSEVEGETTPSTRADRSSDPADPCGKTKVLLSRGISGGGVI